MLSGGCSHSKPDGCCGFAWETCPLGLVAVTKRPVVHPCQRNDVAPPARPRNVLEINNMTSNMTPLEAAISPELSSN